MTRIAVDDVRYEVRSGGRGPAVLLLHGFTGRGADWGPLLPALRRVSTAIVVDLLGHGRSDAPRDPARHALERQASDLAAILRGLGAAPAAVVGYSFGARVALQLALDEPGVVRGLLLESPSAGIADAAARARRRAADGALAEGIERDGIEAFVDSWWETSPVFAAERDLPEATRARFRTGRLRNRPHGLAASLRGAGQGAMTPLHGRLAAIAAPTLVVAGTRDPLGLDRARAVAAAIPDARLEALDGVGHAAHRESPARFRRLALDFLQEVPAA
jgi:2-succinyl-6-hydroxy-2,4-cyclohexadiene-1-carboxylate synthase